jgi:cobalt-precorrin-5B (C1)-methyltransferase
VAWLTIAGGFGKLTKLAAGELDLHSSRSRVDAEFLSRVLADLGAAAELVGHARGAASAGEILHLAAAAGVPLAGAIASRAREVAMATLAGGIAVDVAVFDRQGGLIGHAGP